MIGSRYEDQIEVNNDSTTVNDENLQFTSSSLGKLIGMKQHEFVKTLLLVKFG